MSASAPTPDVIHFKVRPHDLSLVVGPPYGSVLLLCEEHFVAVGINPVDKLPDCIEGYFALCLHGAWLCIHRDYRDKAFVVDASTCIGVFSLEATPEVLADRARLCYAVASKHFDKVLLGDQPLPPVVTVTSLLAQGGVDN